MRTGKRFTHLSRARHSQISKARITLLGKLLSTIASVTPKGRREAIGTRIAGSPTGPPERPRRWSDPKAPIPLPARNGTHWSMPSYCRFGGGIALRLRLLRVPEGLKTREPRVPLAREHLLFDFVQQPLYAPRRARSLAKEFHGPFQHFFQVFLVCHSVDRLIRCRIVELATGRARGRKNLMVYADVLDDEAGPPRHPAGILGTGGIASTRAPAPGASAERGSADSQRGFCRISALVLSLPAAKPPKGSWRLGRSLARSPKRLNMRGSSGTRIGRFQTPV